MFSTPMAIASLDEALGRLEAARTARDASTVARLPSLIRGLARRRYSDAASLIRLHEALLFLRAYPHSPEVLRESEAALHRFGRLVRRFRDSGADMEDFEAPEISGIAGTGLTAGFSYETARRLCRRHPRVDIDWDYTDTHHMGRVLPRFLPLIREDTLVEPHVPYRDWIDAARPPRRNALAWLMDRLDALRVPFSTRAEIYDSLELLLRWELGASSVSRTRARLPCRSVFYHDTPLLRRRDIALADEWNTPPLPVSCLSAAQGRGLVEFILETSATRFRELHGFTFGDPRRVWRAHAGRGLDIFLIGALAEHRLPLRAYHGAFFVKNGVPVGYFEGLSLCERMEVGFNLYYTFRDGESAWLFARLLRLLHQMLGVTCFSMDPYQIGHDNEEAIASGAFWFYRKLGFRPVQAHQARLVEREEKRLARQPGYRTPARTLRRLAESPLVYEAPGHVTGDWDRFHVRNLALALQRYPDAVPALRSPSVLRAKTGPNETLYLRRTQKDSGLRNILLKLGSSSDR